MRHFPYLKLLFFVCICARLRYGLRRTFFFERRRRSDLPQPIFDNKSTVMISLPPFLCSSGDTPFPVSFLPFAQKEEKRRKGFGGRGGGRCAYAHRKKGLGRRPSVLVHLPIFLSTPPPPVSSKFFGAMHGFGAAETDMKEENPKNCNPLLGKSPCAQTYLQCRRREKVRLKAN